MVGAADLSVCLSRFGRYLPPPLALAPPGRAGSSATTPVAPMPLPTRGGAAVASRAVASRVFASGDGGAIV